MYARHLMHNHSTSSVNIIYTNIYTPLKHKTGRTTIIGNNKKVDIQLIDSIELHTHFINP